MKNNLLSEKLIYTGESLTPTHLHLCTYNATEMQESSSDTFQAIKGTLNNDQINWLQIHGMKNTETIREICSHFEIDFLVLQDILNADHPTKIEEHDKYIVLILKIFYPNEHKEENELDELLQRTADQAIAHGSADDAPEQPEVIPVPTRSKGAQSHDEAR